MADQTLEINNLPWVDSHVHAHTLSWNDVESFALGGCRGLVTIAANYFWSPYVPVRPQDVLWLWDLALRWAEHLEASHYYKARVATGIHTLCRVEEWGQVVEEMPRYMQNPLVIAVGETGIEPTQYGAKWEMDDQRACLRAQMEMARDHDKAFILHTPSPKHGTKVFSGAFTLTEPQLEWPGAKLRSAEMALEVIRDVGLDERRVLVDHADPGVADHTLSNSQCFVGFSIGTPWRGFSIKDVVPVLEKHGVERIILDTDLAGSVPVDVLAIPRAMLHLRRFGFSVEEIKRLVFDNPNALYRGAFSEPAS